MPKKIIDITGKRFGALIAMSPVPAAETQDHCPGWLVRCDCGREKVVNGSNLRRGKITSCGCGIVRGKRISESLRNRKSYDDLTGQTFFELTALQYIRKDYWLWQCSCGKTTYARPSLVKNGRIQSCGHVLKATAVQKMQDNIVGYYDGTMVSRLRNLMSDPHTRGIRQVPTSGGIMTYRVRLTLRGKQINLGTYGTCEEAEAARRRAEKKYYLPIIQAYDREMQSKRQPKIDDDQPS